MLIFLNLYIDLALIGLGAGSMILAVIRKISFGGPLLEGDGPHSLKEFVERRRADRQLPVRYN
jgi:hypothetical protein